MVIFSVGKNLQITFPNNIPLVANRANIKYKSEKENERQRKRAQKGKYSLDSMK